MFAKQILPEGQGAVYYTWPLAYLMLKTAKTNFDDFSIVKLKVCVL